MVMGTIRPVRNLQRVVNVVFAIPYLITIFKDAKQCIVQKVVRFVNVTAAQVDG
jgi:hypothetical protein